MDTEINSIRKDKIKARNRGDQKELAELCNYLGNKYKETGCYEEALDEHQEELSICRQLKDKLGTMVAYRCLGEVYAEMERYKEALEHLKVYYQMAEAEKNYTELQRSLATLGRTYFMKSDLSKAEIAHRTALKMAEKVRGLVSDKEYAEMKCRAYLNLALIYDQRNAKNQSMEYYGKAVELANQYGLKETLHRCQNSLAQFYQELEDYPNAMKLLDAAIATAKSLKSRVFIVEYLLARGYLLILAKDYHGARQFFKEACQTKSPAETDQEKAERHLKWTTDICKALKALNRCTDLDEKMQIYDKLGDLFSDFEAYKQAIEYYHLELQLAKELDKPDPVLAAVYVSLAQTYLDDKQYERAVEYFEQELHHRRGNRNEEARTTLKIIEAKIGMGEPPAFIELLYREALDKCSGTNSSRARQRILDDYKSYLQQCGDKEKALEIDLELAEMANDTAAIEDVENDEELPCGGGDSSLPNRDGTFKLSDISDLSSDSDDGGDDNEERDPTAGGGRRSKRSKLGKRNELGETPLHRACIAGNMNEVRKLLESGHPVDVRDHCGWQPLHEAANHGFDEIVLLLIEHGANVNDRGGEKCDGTTPLHDACSNANPKVIRLLLSKGANVASLDSVGNTPLDCLRIWRRRVQELSPEDEQVYNKLVQLLEEAMRKVGLDPAASRNRPLAVSRSPSPVKSLTNELGKRRGRQQQPASSTRGVTVMQQNRNAVALDLDPTNSPPRKKTASTGPTASPQAPDSPPSRHHYQSHRPPPVMCDVSSESDTNDDNEHRVGYAARNSYGKRIRMGTKRTKKSKTDAESRHRRRNSGSIYSDSDDGSTGQRPERVLPLNVADDGRADGDTHYHHQQQKRFSDDDDMANDGVFEEIVAAQVSSSGQQQTANGTDRNNATQLTTQATQQQQLPAEKNDNVLVRVHIEEASFLIKLPDSSRTVGWLAQQTVSRYKRLKKIKPVIYLTTKDGALLSDQDLITDVLQEFEVIAKVQQFDEEPLAERYREECVHLDMEPIGELESELHAAEESGVLNLSQASVCSRHLRAVLDAIRQSDALHSLNISYTWLGGQVKQLVDVIGGLSRLEELQLRCAGLNRPALNALSRLRLPAINHLDLSYNPLDGSCLTLIGELISNFPSLNTLSLISCPLTADDFVGCQRLTTAVADHSRLRRIVLDSFIVADQRLANLFAQRPLPLVLDGHQPGPGLKSAC